MTDPQSTRPVSLASSNKTVITVTNRRGADVGPVQVDAGLPGLAASRRHYARVYHWHSYFDKWVYSPNLTGTFVEILFVRKCALIHVSLK